MVKLMIRSISWPLKMKLFALFGISLFRLISFTNQPQSIKIKSENSETRSYSLTTDSYEKKSFLVLWMVLVNFPITLMDFCEKNLEEKLNR